jgi:hypothetical protein
MLESAPTSANGGKSSSVSTSTIPSIAIPSIAIPSIAVSTSTFSDKKGMSATTSTPTASEIDSALLAAMRDDRERVALWRLESTLCEFLATNNTAAWLEVSGPWNSVVLTDPSAPERLTPKQQAPHAQHAGRQTSFQRCLVHRLADRFGIVRETGQVLEGSIRLIKLADSKIPVPLLQDLDASAFSSSNTTGAGATGSSGVDSLSRQMANQTLQPNDNTTNSKTTITSTDPTTTTKKSKSSKPKKMKIMKRSDKSPGSSSGNDLLSSQTSSTSNSSKQRSEKEKAYAEARARIFNDEASSNNTTPAASTNGSGAGMAPGIVSPDNFNKNNNMTMMNNNNNNNNPVVYRTESNLSSSAVPSRSTSTDSNSGSNHGSYYNNNYNNSNSSPAAAAASIPSATDNRKAVYRNYAEEATDPDFQRGAAAVVFQPAYYDYTGSGAAPGPAASPSSASAVHAHQPIHQHHQQQQHPQQHQQLHYYGMPSNGPTATASAPYTAADHYQQHPQQHAVIAPTISAPPASRSAQQPVSYYNAAAATSAAAPAPNAYYHNPYSAYANNANQHAWQNTHTNSNKTAADSALPNQYQSGR